MQLDAGCRLVLAPRFSTRPGRDGDRLRVSTGTREEGGRYYPRDDWRSPTEGELALLSGPSPTEALRGDDIGLLTISDRLRERWWRLAESEAGRSGPGGGDWFASYAVEVTELLRFKGLPLPEPCSFEATVCRPGQASTRLDPGADPPETLGLAWSRIPPADPPGAAGAPRELAGINLGDGPTAIHYLNLTAAQMAERLGEHGASHPPLDPADGLLRRFLSRFPDYPLVRLTLHPGEGYWLPAAGLAFDGDTLDRDDLLVMLTLRSDGG